MARWDPGAEQRLKRAALELYLERGYDNVTVTDIAERAGLTRRSYFRYFPDKREVLFGGSELLPPALAEAVLAADPDAAPLAAVLDALARVGAQLVEQVDGVTERRAVIDASPELQERERTKTAAITEAIRDALMRRQVNTGTAELVAQLATVAFGNAFRRWIEAGEHTSFGSCLDAVTDELRAAFAGM
ncbi:TetR family transcriptional regulator [Streptomyces malaysiensis subsp. malaysiensis]|uniref:TetR/AcrR family transcriptional regulator n=1 Tax=Streptomyces malaysiensis TaxID=92644 RepID=UPI000BFC8699|nr:TetR/AcrR family transcriptional regulator [Streptomyces malaysiensis]ATL88179.1 transcriptional regulator [Streptomyces malaysiensis]QDL68505.1 TetR family transcriptional regulator [Streptomyces malaysiensis]